MSDEVLIVTCNRDAIGMAVVDPFGEGVPICPNFKGCIADVASADAAAGSTLCCIGGGAASYAGVGGSSSGDFLAVAQARKPLISIWQWGKPQCHMNCHIQEITTALCSDFTGAYLFGGTAKGWIYIWEVATGELVNTFQAHYKAVRQLRVPSGDDCLISASDDGMVRQWLLHQLLDQSEISKSSNQRNCKPHRSWSCHTLPVTDLLMADTAAASSSCSLRVWSSSLDRSIVLFDPMLNSQCARLTLPLAIAALAMNATCDVLCAGSTQGPIYIVDLNATAASFSTAHAQQQQQLIQQRGTNSNSSSRLSLVNPPQGSQVLIGHLKAISGLCFSSGSSSGSLISSSLDGFVRVWNIWTRQCVREFQPLNKCAITNAMLVKRPAILSRSSSSKPTVHPLGSLKKYAGDTSDNSSSGSSSSVLASPFLFTRRAAATTEVSTAAAAAILRTNWIPEPQLLGKRKASTVDNAVTTADDSNNNSSSSDNADFIALPDFSMPTTTAAVAVESSTAAIDSTATIAAVAAASAEADALRQELEKAVAEVKKLKGENARWEKACSQLKQLAANKKSAK